MNFTLIAYKANGSETDGQGYVYENFHSDHEIECSSEEVCIIERWAGFLAVKVAYAEPSWECTLLIDGKPYTDWTDEEQTVATDIRHHAEIRAGQIRERRAEEERVETERKAREKAAAQERFERDQLLVLQHKYATPLKRV